jgi:hypothetical protein
MANTQTLLDNTARIFRIGRKVIGHTQVDVATALGVSQGTVSKYEAGILQPSALDWFNFCTLVNIDSYRSLKDGYIDNCSRIQEGPHQKMGFTLPKRYRERQHLMVREVLPLVNTARAEVSDEQWAAWLKSTKLDPDYLYVYDAPLSLSFMQDLVNADVLRSKPRRFLEKAAKSAGDLGLHGNLGPVYNLETDSQGIVRAYLNKTDLYEDVFSYHAVVQAGRMRLTIEPRLPSGNQDEKAFLDIYLDYKLEALRQLVTENSRQNVPVQIFEDKNRRGLEIGLVT